MKKNDLVKEICSRTGLPKVECEKVLDTFQSVVRDALVGGDSVMIRDFLSFELSQLKARKGYNPQTGKMEDYKSVRTVKCKVGKSIKEAVKEV